MPLLILFKRFEIWLLLAVVAGVLYFAFSSGEAPVEETAGTATQSDPPPVGLPQVLPDPKGTEPEEEKEIPALVVQEIRTEPAEGGKIISLTLSARSLNGEEIVMNDRSLQVSTDTGSQVPQFFAPFQKEQVIRSEEPTEVEMRFWLATGESDSAANTLWLEFQGEKTEAKIPENG